MVKHSICLEDRTGCGAAVLGGRVGGSSVMDGFSSLFLVCLQSSICTSPTVV